MLEGVQDHDGTPVDTSLWAPGRVAGYRESLFEDFGVPLAVMRIPKLGLEVPVLPGTDDVTLNRGVGWIEGTAAPGSDGNFAVAGESAHVAPRATRSSAFPGVRLYTVA